MTDTDVSEFFGWIRKLPPKQAELGRWGSGLQNNCKMTFLKNSKEHAHPPPFPKAQLELPISNLNGRDTGGCSWGLGLQRSNSLEPCGKPGMAGGEVEWAAGDTWKLPKALGWGRVSLFTSGVVTGTEAVSVHRLSVSCRTSQEHGSF